MDPDAIDDAVVAQLDELQPGLFATVARLFLDEYPADLERLRGALATGDAPAARQAAHKLKREQRARWGAGRVRGRRGGRGSRRPG